MRTVIITYTPEEIRVYANGIDTLRIYATGANPIRSRDTEHLLDKAIGFAVGQAAAQSPDRT